MSADIPKDAREVYYNQKGEPIAYCPVDSVGVTDIQRAFFHRENADRLAELRDRAFQKGADDFVVVCIDVNDKTWTKLVDWLMPGHDWEPYRARGETPVARGVVPRAPMEDVVKTFYPAAVKDLKTGPNLVNVLVFAAGGVGVF